MINWLKYDGGDFDETVHRKAIQQTFQEMLTEMPFDKITVTELVKRCEISPNTFYYHYEDIYDLLNHCLVAEVSGYIPTDAAHWQASAKALLHYCQDNRRLIYHIYNSISREQLEQFFFSRVYDVFEQNLRARPEAEGVSDEKVRELADFCCIAFLGFFLRFLWKRMDVDADAAVDHLSELAESFVRTEFGQPEDASRSGKSEDS